MVETLGNDGSTDGPNAAEVDALDEMRTKRLGILALRGKVCWEGNLDASRSQQS
jgi:hypothetical protein